MKYTVVIEASAIEDIEATVLWLANDSEESARSWYRRVRDAIVSLETSPTRCPLAPENESFPEEIRHLLHGRKPHVYRIAFTIQGKTVHVLHVRHGAREPFE